MTNSTDRAVWSAVLDGDGRSFGLIFDRHRDRVFRHLLWAGAEPSDAEDLTATVFLELWRKRASARVVDESLLPWLLATATNVSRNSARAKRRYRRLLSALPLPASETDPVQLAEDRIAFKDRAAPIALADSRRLHRARCRRAACRLGRVCRRALVASATVSFSGVPAPAGVIPEAPIISLLGAPTSQPVTGDADIALGTPPTGATHVRVIITCLTAGATNWGFDAGGNNPSFSCSGADVDGLTYVDFEIEGPTLFIRSNDDVRTFVTIQFLNLVETVWGVNARGETYGTPKNGGEPDLIFAMGLSGSIEVSGYVRRTELNAFGPDWPRDPNSPTEALAWQEERDAKYPHGWDIPLYESDGLTQIGVFHVGGN